MGIGTNRGDIIQSFNFLRNHLSVLFSRTDYIVRNLFKAQDAEI